MHIMPTIQPLRIADNTKLKEENADEKADELLEELSLFIPYKVY